MTIPPPNAENCTQITDTCTIEGTLYGYYPSLGANAFFAGFFGLCAVLNLAAGIKWKTWTFMVGSLTLC